MAKTVRFVEPAPGWKGGMVNLNYDCSLAFFAKQVGIKLWQAMAMMKYADTMKHEQSKDATMDIMKLLNKVQSKEMPIDAAYQIIIDLGNNLDVVYLKGVEDGKDAMRKLVPKDKPVAFVINLKQSNDIIAEELHQRSKALGFNDALAKVKKILK